MARQNKYKNDLNLTGLDRVTGVASENDATVNYTLSAIANYLAQTGNSDGSRLAYHYTYGGEYDPANVVEQGKAYFTFNGISQNFASVASIRFKYKSKDGNDFEAILPFLTEAYIKLTNTNTTGDRGFGIYEVQAPVNDEVREEISIPLAFVSGDGDFAFDEFALTPFGIQGGGGGAVGPAGPEGPQGPMGNPGIFDRATSSTETLDPGEDAEVVLTNMADVGVVDFAFRIPRGEQGEQGPALSVDPLPGVITGNAGTNASASISQVGNQLDFTFTIPRGEQGEVGPAGTGSTINVDYQDSDNVVHSYTDVEKLLFRGTGVNVIENGTTSEIVITDTDTTYTAGAGISISGGVITNTRSPLTDAQVIDAIVRSTQISASNQAAIRENIGAEGGGGGSDYVLPPAGTNANNLGGVYVAPSSKISLNAAGGIDLGDITVADIDSESAAAGYIMTADGNGNAQWSQASDASLPLAADGTRGGIQLGYAENGNNYAVKLDGEQAFVTVPASGTYTLPAATTSTLGGVIVGSGLSVTSGGVLSATGSGAGGSTILVNGTTIDNPNFITYEATGGITFQVAEGATDVIEASINSKLSNTSNATAGHVLTANGDGTVNWLLPEVQEELNWVDGNDSYTGIETIIAGDHIEFDRGTGNDINQLTIKVNEETGVGTHVRIDGEDRANVEIDSNDTEVGGINEEFNSSTNILTFRLGTHGAATDRAQLLGTDDSGNLEWKDIPDDVGTEVKINGGGNETEVDLTTGTGRVGGIDLTHSATNVTFDLSSHGAANNTLLARNSTNDGFEWVPQSNHTPHTITVNGDEIDDPNFQDSNNGANDGNVGVKFTHNNSNVNAHVVSDDLRDATSTSTGVVKLGSDVVQMNAPASDTPFSLEGRTYFVQVDSQGRLVVNVPWTSTTGMAPDLSDLTWNFNTDGAASQDIEVKFTTTKNDAHSNYAVTTTSTSGTVNTDDATLTDPSDAEHTIRITGFTGGTVTATMTYRFEGDTSNQPNISKMISGQVNSNTPEKIDFLSNLSTDNITHTNGAIEAFDTGTYDVLTKAQYESMANTEGWTIGDIDYTPDLNSDGKLAFGANSNAVTFTATANITKNSETMNDYRLSSDDEQSITRVRSFRSGGITSTGDGTTFTPAQVADLATFKDDLITTKTDNPDGFSFQANVSEIGQKQYFMYDAQYPAVDLMQSTQQGFPGLSYHDRGIINGMRVYVSIAGLIPGEILTTLKLQDN